MAIFLIFMLCFPHIGVVIVDNVWLYDAAIHRTHVLNTGDLVEITGEIGDTVKIEYYNATGQTLSGVSIDLALIVKYEDVVGQLLEGVLIDLNEEIAEEKLFIFARGYFDEGAYNQSATLFKTFIDHFSASSYLTEALYYGGLSYEKLAQHLGNPDSLEELILNEKTNKWFYNGDLYKAILERFPLSIYASKAAYRFIKIYRESHLPWQDSISVIQKELKLWQDFITKYTSCEEYVLALLEIGYLYRVLFQISNDMNYKTDAIDVFKKIINEYPNSIHSAQAEVHLYEIKKGEVVYYY